MVKCIVEINSSTVGSTGRIMFMIAETARKHGFTVYTCSAVHGNEKRIESKNHIYIGSKLDKKIHLLLAKKTGYNGCFSHFTTAQFLKKIDKLQPDLIHFHNLHNCYINLPMLFDYVKKKNIPVVWTLHDCWAYTGHCPYYDFVHCKGKIKGWHLVASIIDLILVIVITVGRWEVFYFALAMISAYCLNKSPEDSGLSVKKQNKIRRIKFLIIVAIVVLGGVTIQRHKLSGTIFASILNVVAGYFCCGPALLQVMMKDPVALGISVWHWGQSIFSGLLSCFSCIIQIVSFKRINPVFLMHRHTQQNFMSLVLTRE